ncbi:hypothetical protein POM88_019256 [Heracleum sosnowskyi]|uniref:Protein FAR1-RELATED SEQUENCE n=1 Tax=Heracleum sosnowskyi TaxID=360622 RepID=A0AAD8IU34_9APIA|nr:hypothetical protein POM88_019256 [Heracleum sosnowskyi]
MCGILCRHAFCALNHFGLVKIPRRLVLNRWMKNAENKPSSLFVVSNDIQNMDVVSSELTTLWFTFHKCVTRVESGLQKLKLVTKTIKDLHSSLADDGVVFSKKDFIKNLVH